MFGQMVNNLAPLDVGRKIYFEPSDKRQDTEWHYENDRDNTIEFSPLKKSGG